MKPVGKHFAKLTQKAYDRYGHAWAGLLANWQTIAGDALYQISVPVKIVWPGKVQASRHQKLGGVLTLKIAYGRALEVQHSAPQIIDKINDYYGYAAIGRMKIIQGKITVATAKKRKILPPLSPDVAAGLDTELTGIQDPSLKTALEKLAKGALAHDQAE